MDNIGQFRTPGGVLSPRCTSATLQKQPGRPETDKPENEKSETDKPGPYKRKNGKPFDDEEFCQCKPTHARTPVQRHVHDRLAPQPILLPGLELSLVSASPTPFLIPDLHLGESI